MGLLKILGLEKQVSNYKTVDGIVYGGKSPMREEIERKFEKVETNRHALIQKVKKGWGFPRKVEYMPGYSGVKPFLIITASNPEKAKEIIMKNKDVIEKSCDAKISEEIGIERWPTVS